MQTIEIASRFPDFSKACERGKFRSSRFGVSRDGAVPRVVQEGRAPVRGLEIVGLRRRRGLALLGSSRPSTRRRARKGPSGGMTWMTGPVMTRFLSSFSTPEEVDADRWLSSVRRDAPSVERDPPLISVSEFPARAAPRVAPGRAPARRAPIRGCRTRPTRGRRKSRSRRASTRTGRYPRSNIRRP